MFSFLNRRFFSAPPISRGKINDSIIAACTKEKSDSYVRGLNIIMDTISTAWKPSFYIQNPQGDRQPAESPEMMKLIAEPYLNHSMVDLIKSFAKQYIETGIVVINTHGLALQQDVIAGVTRQPNILQVLDSSSIDSLDFENGELRKVVLNSSQDSSIPREIDGRFSAYYISPTYDTFTSTKIRPQTIDSRIQSKIQHEHLLYQSLISKLVNSSQPSKYFNVNTEASQQQYEQIESYISQSEEAGTEQHGKSLVLQGVDLKEVTRQGVLQTELNALIDARSDIFQALGVTPLQLGDVPASISFLALQESNETFYTNVINPIIEGFTCLFNSFVAPSYSPTIKLGYESTVPQLVGELEQRALSLYSSNVISLNEARAMISREPVDNGESFSFELRASADSFLG